MAPLALALAACGGSSGSPGPPAPASSSASPAAVPGASRYFPAEAVWYQDVSRAPLDADSSRVIAYLDRVGWGLGRLQIDFSLELLEAAADTPRRAFTPTDDHFTPDCDLDPVPLPPGGALEGEQGYECRSDGDCHLLVVDRSRQQLFEMWRADIPGRAVPRRVPGGLADGPRVSPERPRRAVHQR